MTTITVRIYTPLNENLEKISYQTGILKSSLILYAINDIIRNSKVNELQSISYKSDDTVRSTLRIPGVLKELLEKTAKENNLSINSLINNAVHSFCISHWLIYL
ncbi:Ribbon-helix-helix protein, copG family [Clostridioides difficile]|nr:Ribbon-helix-helix protein, copG family [Clostridioides difficile]